MKRINNIKLKSLKQTRAFYIWELKRKESLTESERSKYLIALKSIEKIIKEKEDSRDYREREKYKKFIPDDHRAVFRNSKRGY
ncbi:hypothetical protein ES695_02090 [Candidatus Atribacteria bacterium 1244-E10-H5-B2]|jgi:hypothetical protein|nr:MAG: hypothetical protein ES695_02090 [Candidatus Atribacteria bacterium 1244-E10-H5-B2]